MAAIAALMVDIMPMNIPMSRYMRTMTMMRRRIMYSIMSPSFLKCTNPRW